MFERIIFQNKKRNDKKRIKVGGMESSSGKRSRILLSRSRSRTPTKDRSSKSRKKSGGRSPDHWRHDKFSDALNPSPEKDEAFGSHWSQIRSERSKERERQSKSRSRSRSRSHSRSRSRSRSRSGTRSRKRKRSRGSSSSGSSRSSSRRRTRRRRSFSSSYSRSRSRSLSVSSASSDSVRREVRRHKAAKAAAKANGQKDDSVPREMQPSTSSHSVAASSKQSSSSQVPVQDRANDEVSFGLSGKLLVRFCRNMKKQPIILIFLSSNLLGRYKYNQWGGCEIQSTGRGQKAQDKMEALRF